MTDKQKEMLSEEQPVEEAVVEEVVEEPVVEASTEEEVVEESVEQNSEESVEEATEEVVEEPAEEVVEGKVEEEVAEEVVEAESEEGLSEQEELKKQIAETREELGVLNEVRSELIAAYARNRNLEKKVESLSSELSDKSKSVHELKEQLSVYIEAEKRLEAKRFEERVESLSQKFSKLGQVKTVEELSAKDVETLSEYEKIVDAALSRLGDISESESLTAPSQSAEESEAPAEPQVPEEKLEISRVELEKLRTPENADFFAGLAKRMSGEQQISGRKISYY